MDIQEINQPTYEMGTDSKQWSFFSDLQWAEENRPETVTVDATGIKFHQNGEVRSVLVSKGEIATKMQHAGALGHEFFKLLEMTPDQTVEFILKREAE